MAGSLLNNITLAGLFIASPSAAFAELRERPRFLFPLIALVVATGAVTAWYYSIVDYEWLKDHLVTINKPLQAMSEAERAKTLSMMSQKMILATNVIGVAVFFPAVLALQAAYCMLAGKITNVQQSFLHWFALLSWSNIPVLAGAAASLALLVSQSGPVQMDQLELQLLSLNELFFHRGPTDAGYDLLSGMGLISFWVWGLAIAGVRAWSKRSWLFSALFVLLPFIVIYGVLAFLAFKS
jgi:hypothetical protein